MRALESLKEDWKKKEKDLPKLSYDELHNMLWKRSSSIVKWIFYISVFELLLTILLNTILLDINTFKTSNSSNLSRLTSVFDVVSYTILIVFIIKFYKNYKNISVIDDSKTLMKNILKTRKTVKNYIKIMLSMSGIYTMMFLAITLLSDSELHDRIVKGFNEKSQFLFGITIIVFVLLFVGVLLVFFWGLYQLLYGILLKKLNKNYKELNKLEL